jgi:hypothetical protein
MTPKNRLSRLCQDDCRSFFGATGSRFGAHLEATKQHVSRLESIFESVAQDPGSRECRPMQALLDAGAKLIGESEKSTVLDAGIVAAAQKVEHYEMAGYRTVCALSEIWTQRMRPGKRASRLLRKGSARVERRGLAGVKYSEAQRDTAENSAHTGHSPPCVAFAWDER